MNSVHHVVKAAAFTVKVKLATESAMAFVCMVFFGKHYAKQQQSSRIFFFQNIAWWFDQSFFDENIAIPVESTKISTRKN